MRYTVRKSIVEVIGKIWMPAVTCAQVYTLSAYDLGNARDDDGQLTRESVEDWLSTHAGDFQSIEDFHASLEDGAETIEMPWASEDGEMTFCDCMYPSEEVEA
jgi:hypothetical protein